MRSIFTVHMHNHLVTQLIIVFINPTWDTRVSPKSQVCARRPCLLLIVYPAVFLLKTTHWLVRLMYRKLFWQFCFLLIAKLSFATNAKLSAALCKQTPKGAWWDCTFFDWIMQPTSLYYYKFTTFISYFPAYIYNPPSYRLGFVQFAGPHCCMFII